MSGASRRIALWIVLVLASGVAGAQVGMGRLTGSVRNEPGRPLKGAAITAESPNVAPSTLTAATDPKGRFSLIGLRQAIWIERSTPQ